jgi:hypothetical protein
LTIEGLQEITRYAVEAVNEEVVSPVREYCGGEVSWSTEVRNYPWAVLE